MRPDRRSMTAISAVAVLGAVEGLQGYGVSILTPEVGAALKVSALSIVSARVLGLIIGATLPLVTPALAATRRRSVRVWLCRVAAMICALTLAATGELTTTGALVGALCLTAIASAPSRAVHRAMVVATADESVRVSALSVITLAAILAQLGLALGLALGVLDSWDKALEWSGFVGIGAVLLWSFLLGPTGGSDEPAADEDLPWQEIWRAWRATPSLVGVGITMLGVAMLLVPFEAVLSIYLHSRWHLGLQGTGTVFLVIASSSFVAVAANAARADRLLVEASSRLAREVWRLLAVAAVLIGVGLYLSNRTAMVVTVAIGSAGVAATVPLLGALGFAVVPPAQRPQLSAALAALASAGAVAGVILTTTFANRHGARSALVATAVVGLLAAAFWRVRSRSVMADRQRIVDALADRQGELARIASGGHAPLLECRGINFSYGSLHVLFDVDFAVDDGEVVALLGTNGAGKSTLLKVISGIGLPQRGTVRLAGRDITYLDAEERVHAGITQVPGGRAVFASMTVIENLQSFAYTLGRDRRAVDEAVDRCLDAFPRLAERRTSLAATLSGGEQQMLGLSKALILRPRLLLIDELSLGLAPVVVGPLLDMVRRINSAGTTVVIVEQSVNIALSLVDRAYFMEKGTVRFEGRAKDLLERSDLLRAVFLEGAAKGTLG
jgi:ABC-type branched-subunit amino acid transport system ATPase component